MKVLTLIIFIFFATVSFAEVISVDHVLKLSEADAMKKAAFKVGTYDNEKTELSFKINNARGKAFRLVHNGKKVFALVDGSPQTVTSTLHTIEEFTTEKKAEDRIKELGLQYEKDQPWIKSTTKKTF